MKSRAFRTITGSFIFLLIIAVVAAALQPVYHAVDSALKTCESVFKTRLSKETGLGLSYKSLSPSLLTGIRIKGIVLYETENDAPILSVSNAVLGYSLPKIIKGDFSRAFTRLVLTDVSLDFSDSRYKAILDRLGSSGANNGADGAAVSEKKAPHSSDSSDATGEGFASVLDFIKDALFSLPFDVQIRNMNLGYEVGNDSFHAVLNDLFVRKDGLNSSLYSRVSGYAFARLSALGSKTAGFRFRAEGNLLSVFSGSSCRILLDSYSRADYTPRRMEYLLHYSSPEFVLRSTQRILPYAVQIVLDRDSLDLSAELTAQNLDPFALLGNSYSLKQFSKFRGSTLSGSAGFGINLETFRYKWNADLSASLSKSIASGGQQVSVRAFGDDSSVTVKNLSAKGQIAALSFEGSLDLKDKSPSGSLELEHFVLPNGGIISGSLLCSPDKNGFSLFVPELSLGTRKFSHIDISVQNEDNGSLGFSAEVFDYSHSEYDNPGKIIADGSFSYKNNPYLQASVSVDSFFVDSAVYAAAFFAEGNSPGGISSVAASLAPYITSTEFYISTNFSGITFNVPYAVFANTEKDREMLFLSFDGTETALQVSQLELLYGGNSLNATLEADFSPVDKQAAFRTDFNLNSIPYSLSGTYALGEWISVIGDYGFNASVNLGKSCGGTLDFSSLPLSLGKYMLSLSAIAEFSFTSAEDFNVTLSNLTVDEITGLVPGKPKFSLAATADQSGIVLSSLSYNDTISYLQGWGYFLWNINDGIFDSMNFNLTAANDVTKESVTLAGDLSNPMRQKLDFDTLTKDCYFSAQADVKSFPCARFLSEQDGSDTVTATITASGTFENPYISAQVKELSLNAGGSTLKASGNASIMEGILTVPQLNGSWKNFTLESSGSKVDLMAFEGSASLSLSMTGGQNSFTAPMQFTLTNLSPFTRNSFAVPEAFSVEFDCAGISGAMKDKLPPVHISLIRSPGRWDIMTDENLGAYGEFLDDGSLSLMVREDRPLNFNLDGTLVNGLMNLSVRNLYCDTGRFSFLFNSQFFSVYSGFVNANLTLSGLASDPDIDGSAVVTDFDFNIPVYIPEHFKAHEVSVEFTQDEIVIPETIFSVKDGRVAADAYVSLDRLSVTSLELNVETERNRDIPVDVKTPLVRVTGRTSVKATLGIEDNVVGINGSIALRNAEISFITNFGTNQVLQSEEVRSDAPSSPFDLSLNLDLLVGQKVQIILNPLLRGLVAPATPVQVFLDTASGLWSVKGDIVLRGGEISYLSRNFYLKEGRLIMDETQNGFDPNITVRAETREHDDNGEPVTISLSAISQELSSFSATLSSSPAKSESEILSLLGQIATGDSDSVGNFLVAGVDYGVQVTVLRKLENALRDLCNFDIFSIRTTLLQNTIRQGFNMNTESEKGSIISNLFDNSTVYIGKYFGSTIYADALMHWTYDKSRADASGADAGGGLVFQPEIGLELDAPFANIRWNFAPDIGQLQKSWVPATSITLSWRISF